MASCEEGSGAFAALFPGRVVDQARNRSLEPYQRFKAHRVRRVHPEG